MSRDDIHLDLTPPSGDDPSRKELLWEKREEEHLRMIAAACGDLSKRHDARGAVCRSNYVSLGLPAAVLPLVGSAVVEYVPKEYSFIVTIIMLLAAVASALNTFLDWGRKSQRHSEFAGRYGELVNEIESQLCRPKAGRIACDIMLERVKERYGHLNTGAPPL
jgi:hypothetical protein